MKYTYTLLFTLCACATAGADRDPDVTPDAMLLVDAAPIDGPQSDPDAANLPDAASPPDAAPTIVPFNYAYIVGESWGDQLVNIHATATIEDDCIIEDLEVMFNLTHSYAGDLMVQVIHDGTGRKVALFDRAANALTSQDIVYHDYWHSDDWNRTWFGYNENPAVSDRFRPDDLSVPMSTFEGLSLAGSWTLSVQDFFALDGGTWHLIGFRGTCLQQP